MVLALGRSMTFLVRRDRGQRTGQRMDGTGHDSGQRQGRVHGQGSDGTEDGDRDSGQ